MTKNKKCPVCNKKIGLRAGYRYGYSKILKNVKMYYVYVCENNHYSVFKSGLFRDKLIGVFENKSIGFIESILQHAVHNEMMVENIKTLLSDKYEDK